MPRPSSRGFRARSDLLLKRVMAFEDAGAQVHNVAQEGDRFFYLGAVAIAAENIPRLSTVEDLTGYLCCKN